MRISPDYCIHYQATAVAGVAELLELCLAFVAHAAPLNPCCYVPDWEVTNLLTPTEN